VVLDKLLRQRLEMVTILFSLQLLRLMVGKVAPISRELAAVLVKMAGQAVAVSVQLVQARLVKATMAVKLLQGQMLQAAVAVRAEQVATPDQAQAVLVAHHQTAL
jgi:hypothetical protein